MIQKVGNALYDNRKIAAFLSGQAISLFGSSLVQYALMWHLVRTTDSGTIMGIFTLFMMAPQIPMSLFGGVMADRYNRKLLIMLSDSGIACATLMLCILMLLGDYGFVPLLIVAAIRSLGSGIQGPAVSAILPQLTEPENLMRINSINATMQSLVMLLSPAAAAYVYATFSLPGILMIDVVTAMIGVGILACMHVPTHERNTDAENTHVLTDLKTGFRYAIGSTFIKRMTLYYTISSFLVVPAATFTPLFVGRAYGSDPFYLKYNEMMFFVGSVLGGLIIS